MSEDPRPSVYLIYALGIAVLFAMLLVVAFLVVTVAGAILSAI